MHPMKQHDQGLTLTMGWVGEKQTTHSKEQGTEKGDKMKTSMAEGAKQRIEFMFGRSRKSNRLVKFGQEYKTHEKHNQEVGPDANQEQEDWKVSEL